MSPNIIFVLHRSTNIFSLMKTIVRNPIILYFLQQKCTRKIFGCYFGFWFGVIVDIFVFVFFFFFFFFFFFCFFIFFFLFYFFINQGFIFQHHLIYCIVRSAKNVHIWRNVNCCMLKKRPN
jgi:hypothetical protein